MDITQEVLAEILLIHNATLGSCPLMHLASGSAPMSACEVSSCSGGGGKGMICFDGPNAYRVKVGCAPKEPWLPKHVAPFRCLCGQLKPPQPFVARHWALQPATSAAAFSAQREIHGGRQALHLMSETYSGARIVPRAVHRGSGQRSPAVHVPNSCPARQSVSLNCHQYRVPAGEGEGAGAGGGGGGCGPVCRTYSVRPLSGRFRL